MTDHEKLKTELRLFLELYITKKNEIILGAIKASDRDQYLDRHKFWTIYQKEKPPRINDTILKLINFIRATYFRFAVYTNPVENMEEDHLVNLLDSFDAGDYQLVLLVSDQEVSPMQMPLLLDALKGVEENKITTKELSNPPRRASTFFNDPVPPSPGRYSTPRPADTSLFHLGKLSNILLTNSGSSSGF